MSRRLFAHMVARDEADRYLQAALSALRPHVDAIHVHDDLSRDGTVETALEMGATVTVRGLLTPAFLEDESACRQGAWDAFLTTCEPRSGDWVLAVDADELLVAPGGLWAAVNASALLSVALPIPEVWAIVDGRPMVRTDGAWGTLSAPRLFSYQDDGLFQARKLAGGSVPSFVRLCPQSLENRGVQLAHLGYLDPEDRRQKHLRYSGRRGHASAHVDSIMRDPRLRAWDGPPLDIWRGRR